MKIYNKNIENPLYVSRGKPKFKKVFSIINVFSY